MALAATRVDYRAPYEIGEVLPGTVAIKVGRQHVAGGYRHRTVVAGGVQLMVMAGAFANGEGVRLLSALVAQVVAIAFVNRGAASQVGQAEGGPSVPP